MVPSVVSGVQQEKVNRFLLIAADRGKKGIRMSEETKERVSLSEHPMKGQQAVPRESWGITGRDHAPMLDVPVQEVRLPSKGRVYPVESALHNKETVEIRSMTAREEDILTSRALLRQGKAISQLLRNCIVDKSIEPDEMIVGDRNAILVAIRVSGYGAGYETRVECPECEESFDHTFDLSQVPVEDLKQEPEAAGRNLFSFKLPMSGRVVRFKLLTGAEERELSTIQERTKKAKGVGGVESIVTSRLFHQIVSIDSEDDRGKLQRLVNSMIAGDSRALRNHMDSVAPGLDMTSTITCAHCGTESEVDMPMGAEFFWPRT